MYNVYFNGEIANALEAAVKGKYGSTIPKNGEYLEALDAVGAVFGLERVMPVSGGVRWVEKKEGEQ